MNAKNKDGKLEKCNHCGNDAVLEISKPLGSERKWYKVYCDNLDCRISTLKYSKKSIVLSIWNRRVRK